MNKPVFIIGTMDTKGKELSFVAEQIRASEGSAVIVDAGTSGQPQEAADVTRETVAKHHPDGASAVMEHEDRGQAIIAMSEALRIYMLAQHEAGKVGGAIGLGGTGGTSLISPALRALPIGMPKALVSTVASGNTEPYVGITDIAMFNSVIDISGLNAISRKILGNAAHAIAGMVNHAQEVENTKPAVGITMFGVTTPCVSRVRETLEADGRECLVFHATGTGGRAMEHLTRSGMIDVVLDLTTTEVADEVVGGVFRAGPERFDYLAQSPTPCILSLGALDMVNFGAMDTVPEQFSTRKLHVHNASVTLMRTTPEENRAFAQWMAHKLNQAVGPLTVVIPEGGVSLLDAPDQPFWDPVADNALFEELEKLFVQTDTHRIVRLPCNINDPEFSDFIAQEYRSLISS